MRVVCDTGPIISLSNACLLYILDKMPYDFLITPFVLKELVTFPYHTKHHLLSAIRIKDYVSKGVLRVVDLPSDVLSLADEIYAKANSLFRAGGRKLKIIQRGEVEALALALSTDKVLCIDERTTRLLVEDPFGVAELFERRLGRRVNYDKERVEEFSEMLKDVLVIRSAELVARASELGIIKGGDFLKGALYAVKYSGCSISEDEIVDYVGE